ncbi:MAG: SH3 domain-containing protein [Bacteroidales bacterium]|nr:SH3 domain-containing protein [Bacteroidales bacterium]MCQ2605429.1 SH3 domain-containing protein [Bacteroidales bacterium]
MKTGVKILIVVAIVAIIAAVAVYFVYFREKKVVEPKKDGLKQYKVVTESTGLNVRKSADVNSEKLGTLSKDSIVNVEKIENGWAYLPTFGGWASVQYLEEVKE